MEQYFEKRGYRIVLIKNGKVYNPIIELPHFNASEEETKRKLVEKQGIPHFIMGQNWYCFAPNFVKVKKVTLPYYEEGEDTGAKLTRELLTEETVRKAQEFWRRLYEEKAKNGQKKDIKKNKKDKGIKKKKKKKKKK